MPMLWIFYFISCLLFTSSQYIYSNKNVDCKSDEIYEELLGEIQTLRRQQIKLQRELNEQRQDNKEIRDLLVSRNLTSGKMPFDCSDIYKNGERKTGIYKIYPSDEINKGVSAFCYMYPQLGGQTVIQKRFGMYYSNFNRTWDDFKRGFGYVGGDYWLGNDVIHKLTTTFPNDLYIKIKGYFDVKYSSFSISDEANGYRLSLGTKSGNITDAFRSHNIINQPFFTFDHDNVHRCANRTGSGWWFNNCAAANLNAPFSDNSTPAWFPLIPSWNELWGTEMLIGRQ